MKNKKIVRWPVDGGVLVCWWWELPGARGSGYLQPQAVYTFNLFLNLFHFNILIFKYSTFPRISSRCLISKLMLSRFQPSYPRYSHTSLI